MESNVVILQIQVNDSAHVIERRFPPSLSIDELKNRLEVLTGASAATMELCFYTHSDERIGKPQDDRTIGHYVPLNGINHLKLTVKDDNVLSPDCLSQVPKYEMGDEDYEKRNDSVRMFKLKNKLGRFSDKAGVDEEQSLSQFAIGDRCEVKINQLQPRRGQIMYLGKIGNKSGVFVGVRYDEPCGKNDGSFEGTRYFECPPNYGSFVNPNCVTVGDYPEEEINFDE